MLQQKSLFCFARKLNTSSTSLHHRHRLQLFLLQTINPLPPPPRIYSIHTRTFSHRVLPHNNYHPKPYAIMSEITHPTIKGKSAIRSLPFCSFLFPLQTRAREYKIPQDQYQSQYQQAALPFCWILPLPLYSLLFPPWHPSLELLVSLPRLTLAYLEHVVSHTAARCF